MPSARTLNISTVFGRSLDDTVLLAEHPDEAYDADGNPRRDCRTLVLRLHDKRAVYVEQLPMPLSRSWYSTSGVAYCSSIARRTLYTYAAGRWSEEVFAAKPVSFVRYVFAVPGASPADDTVFLGTEKQLFIRRRGTWQSKRTLGDGDPWQIHGVRSDRVYLGAADFSVWDGKALRALEGPDDDSLSGLVVLPDGRIVGGSTSVHISTKTGGWKAIDTPIEDFYQFARLGNDVYAVSSYDGVCRIHPGKPKVVTRELEASGLVSVGNGLVAFGDDGCLVFDGKRWSEVRIPTCVKGKEPATK